MDSNPWNVIIRDSDPKTIKSDSAHLKQWKQIDSFEGLPTIETLISLDVTGSQINSFFGAQPQPSLRRFRCTKTPLSENKNVSLMAVIVFGDNLTHVNGEEIDYKIRDLAFNYKDELKNLLTSEKWVITSSTPLKLINTVTRKIKRIFIERPTDSDKDKKENDVDFENSSSIEILSTSSEDGIKNDIVIRDPPSGSQYSTAKSTGSAARSQYAQSLYLLFPDDATNDIPNDAQDIEQQDKILERKMKEYLHKKLVEQVDNRKKEREVFAKKHHTNLNDEFSLSKFGSPSTTANSTYAKSVVSPGNLGYNYEIIDDNLSTTSAPAQVGRNKASSVASPSQAANQSPSKKIKQKFKPRSFNEHVEREIPQDNEDIKSILDMSSILSESESSGNEQANGKLSSDSYENDKRSRKSNKSNKSHHTDNNSHKSAKGQSKVISPTKPSPNLQDADGDYSTDSYNYFTEIESHTSARKKKQDQKKDQSIPPKADKDENNDDYSDYYTESQSQPVAKNPPPKAAGVDKESDYDYYTTDAQSQKSSHSKKSHSSSKKQQKPVGNKEYDDYDYYTTDAQSQKSSHSKKSHHSTKKAAPAQQPPAKPAAGGNQYDYDDDYYTDTQSQKSSHSKKSHSSSKKAAPAQQPAAKPAAKPSAGGNQYDEYDDDYYTDTQSQKSSHSKKSHHSTKKAAPAQQPPAKPAAGGNQYDYDDDYYTDTQSQKSSHSKKSHSSSKKPQPAAKPAAGGNQYDEYDDDYYTDTQSQKSNHSKKAAPAQPPAKPAAKPAAGGNQYDEYDDDYYTDTQSQKSNHSKKAAPAQPAAKPAAKPSAGGNQYDYDDDYYDYD